MNTQIICNQIFVQPNYILLGQSATTTLRFFIIKIIILEYNFPGVAIWIHSTLHLLMTPYIIYFLDKSFKTVPNIRIGKSTSFNE